jgi:hypothetical protein
MNVAIGAAVSIDGRQGSDYLAGLQSRATSLEELRDLEMKKKNTT